jgi:hypothetical protein
VSNRLSHICASLRRFAAQGRGCDRFCGLYTEQSKPISGKSAQFPREAWIDTGRSGFPAAFWRKDGRIAFHHNILRLNDKNKKSNSLYLGELLIFFFTRYSKNDKINTSMAEGKRSRSAWQIFLMTHP